MIYYVPPQIENPKHTKMAVAYRKEKLGTTNPVIDQPALALVRADYSLDRMTGLNVNWRDLGAEPPNKMARDIARSVLSCAYMIGLEPSLVTASAASGVGICFKREGKYADIECFNSGEITSAFIDSEGTTYAWEVGAGAGSVIEALNRIKQNLNA